MQRQTFISLCILFCISTAFAQRLVPLVEDTDVFPFVQFESSTAPQPVAIYQEELLMAGKFKNWSTDSINYVARWNGHEYLSLGNNNLSISSSYKPLNLEVINDSLHILITQSLASSFVLRYDDSSGNWNQLGDTINERGFQLLQWNNRICLATQTGGLFVLDENNLWTLLYEWPTSTFVKGIVWQNDLYMIGTTSAQDYLYKHDGLNWVSVALPADAQANSFAIIDNTLCVAGSFAFNGNNTGLASIANNSATPSTHNIPSPATDAIQVEGRVYGLVSSGASNRRDFYEEDVLLQNNYDFATSGATLMFEFQNTLHIACKRNYAPLPDVAGVCNTIALPHALVFENHEPLQTNQYFFNTTGTPLIGVSIPDYYMHFRLNEDLGEHQIMSMMSLWQMTEIAGDTAFNYRDFFYTNDFDSWTFGPVGDVVDKNYLTKYARSWRLSAAEIELHQQQYNQANYQMPESIHNWPAHGNFDNGEAFNLAPFVDVNGNTYYEPQLGDYPKIPGEEALFMMMNDALDAPNIDGTIKANAEIQLFFYTENNTSEALGNTMFVHGTVINRGNETWTNHKLGLYNEWRLGFDNGNDFQGIDSLLNYVFEYSDTTGIDSDFGNSAPAMACVVLSEPILNHVSFGYSDDPQNGPAFNRADRENYINGLGRLGTPLEGTDVNNPGWLNSGDPCLGETDTELYRQETSELNNTLSTLGPHDIGPGQFHCFDYAFVLSYDSTLADLDNLCALEEKVIAVRGFYTSQNNTCELATSVEKTSAQNNLLLWPNPTNEAINVKLPLSLHTGTVSIYDFSGKRIFQSTYANQNQLSMDASWYPNGLYTLVLTNESGELSSTKWVKCD
jgi:hypothetical protein